MDNNIIIVHQASTFPQAGFDALQAHQGQANPILPTLLKCLSKENQGFVTKDHLWAIIFSRRNPNQVLFVLSITNSILSTYPVFLFTTIPYQYQAFENTIGPMKALVQKLRTFGVSRSRIYSVFGPMAVASSFANAWTELTGILVTDTYYDSWLATLTPETFLSGRARSYDTPELQFRLANLGDIPQTGRLCYDFAQTSHPFEISVDQAMKEAKYLVTRQLVWICLARFGREWQVVSLVAYTRNTETAATITKVFTLQSARGRGIAPALTSTVCRYLFDQGKRQISLFVGVHNKAGSVYERLGFPVPPIPENDQPVPTGSETRGAERWIELGFQRDRVHLGNW